MALAASLSPHYSEEASNPRELTQVNQMDFRGLTPRAELVTCRINLVQQNNIRLDSLLIYPIPYAVGGRAWIHQHQYTPICDPPESRQGLRDYGGE